MNEPFISSLNHSLTHFEVHPQLSHMGRRTMDDVLVVVGLLKPLPSTLLVTSTKVNEKKVPLSLW
jgi:hypothetical protein